VVTAIGRCLRLAGLHDTPERRRSVLLIFCWTAGLQFLLRLPVLTGKFYSPDDWTLAHGKPFSGWLLSEGRFGYVAVYDLFYALGANPVQSYQLLSLFAILFGAVSTVLLALYWRIDGWIAPSIAAGLLFELHPFQAELWSFRFVPFFHQLALMVALAGLLAARRRGAGIVVGATLLAFAASIYQISLSFAATALCMRFLVDACRADVPKEDRSALLRELFTLTASPLAYLAINRVVLKLSGTSGSFRTALLPLSAVSERLSQLGAQLGWMLGAKNGLLPDGLSALSAILVLAALVAQTRGKRPTAAAAGVVVAAGAVALGCVASVGVALPLKDWWPTPRLVSSLGLVWSSLAVAAVTWNTGWVRMLSWATVVLLLVGAIGVSDHVFLDENRVNSRDLMTINRVLARFERLPEYRRTKRLAVIGHPWLYEGISTSVRDLNISSLAVAWAASGVLSEAEGRTIEPPNPQDLEIARAQCSQVPHWPAEGSVLVKDDLAVACF
jgi:hypothetical protein